MQVRSVLECAGVCWSVLVQLLRHDWKLLAWIF
jgi:hypothetical protein